MITLSRSLKQPSCRYRGTGLQGWPVAGRSERADVTLLAKGMVSSLRWGLDDVASCEHARRARARGVNVAVPSASQVSPDLRLQTRLGCFRISCAKRHGGW